MEPNLVRGPVMNGAEQLPPPIQNTIAPELTVIPSFPVIYNYLLIVLVLLPIVAGILSNVMQLAGTFGAMFISLAGIITAIICLVILALIYIAQVRYIHAYYPQKRFIAQLITPIIITIVMIGAIVMGDVSGAAAFNNSVHGISGDIYGGLAIGLGLSYFFSVICLVGNALFIATKATAEWLKVIGWIFLVIAWLCVAIMAYFAYTIEYSSHDPSSE